MARKKKREPTAQPPGQHTHHTPADAGRPETWPTPHSDTSTIHDEKTGQQSDNANSGKVTSEGPIPPL